LKQQLLKNWQKTLKIAFRLPIPRKGIETINLKKVKEFSEKLSAYLFPARGLKKSCIFTTTPSSNSFRLPNTIAVYYPSI